MYGSLALTGKGHATDVAVILGLSGEQPDTVEPDAVPAQVARVRETQRLLLGGQRNVAFIEDSDLRFHRKESLPRHPNGMRFAAFDGGARELHQDTFYSAGGGFVVSEAEAAAA